MHPARAEPLRQPRHGPPGRLTTFALSAIITCARPRTPQPGNPTRPPSAPRCNIQVRLELWFLPWCPPPSTSASADSCQIPPPSDMLPPVMMPRCEPEAGITHSRIPPSMPVGGVVHIVRRGRIPQCGYHLAEKGITHPSPALDVNDNEARGWLILPRDHLLFNRFYPAATDRSPAGEANSQAYNVNAVMLVALVSFSGISSSCSYSYEHNQSCRSSF